MFAPDLQPKPGKRLAATATAVSLGLLAMGCGKTDSVMRAAKPPNSHVRAHKERRYKQPTESKGLTIGSFLNQFPYIVPTLSNRGEQFVFNPKPLESGGAQDLVTIYDPAMSNELKKLANINNPQLSAGVLLTSFDNAVDAGIVTFNSRSLQVVTLENWATLHKGYHSLFGDAVPIEKAGLAIMVEPVPTAMGYYGVEISIGGVASMPITPVAGSAIPGAAAAL